MSFYDFSFSLPPTIPMPRHTGLSGPGGAETIQKQPPGCGWRQSVVDPQLTLELMAATDRFRPTGDIGSANNDGGNAA